MRARNCTHTTALPRYCLICGAARTRRQLANEARLRRWEVWKAANPLSDVRPPPQRKTLSSMAKRLEWVRARLDTQLLRQVTS